MKKMDEMEVYHTLQSAKIVCIASIVFEFICWISSCIMAKTIIITDMFVLLLFQSALLNALQLYFKLKAGDSRGKKGILILIVTVILIIILFGIYLGGRK